MNYDMEENIIKNHIKTDLPYDILEIYFSKINITVNDGYHFKLPETLNKDKGLILFGAAPIWLYLMLYKKIKEQGAAAWVAQFDSRLATAVNIDATNNTELLIPYSAFQPWLPFAESEMIIAFIGPPHSGKSVFMYALFNQLLALNPVFVYRNFFVIKGCPDGEAHWSAGMPASLLKEIRIKRPFTDEFLADVLKQLDNAARFKKILFVDCGGKIDPYNNKILAKCTHAILISSDREKAEHWLRAYPDIKYLAKIDSYLSSNHPEKQSQLISKKDDAFYMELVDLSRNAEQIAIPRDFLEFFLKSAK